jgi:hypothetical protein
MSSPLRCRGTGLTPKEDAAYGRSTLRRFRRFAAPNRTASDLAVIASLTETCKLNGIDPHAYLADVITKIVNDHPNSRIDSTQGCGLKTAITISRSLKG